MKIRFKKKTRFYCVPYKKTGIIICLPHVNNTFEVEGMLLFPVSVVHLLSSRHFDFIIYYYTGQINLKLLTHIFSSRL